MRFFHASRGAQPCSAPISRSICSHIAVSTAPGHTQLDVILSGASTCAAVRVRLITPALEAL